MSISTADRLAIHELVALHGHIAYDRTPERLDELFTADAILDVEAFGYGVQQGLDRLRELFGADGANQPVGHHTTNVVVTEDSDGTVRAKSKGIGIGADGSSGSVVYEDVLARTSDGWRIARRTVRPSRS